MSFCVGSQNFEKLEQARHETLAHAQNQRVEFENMRLRCVAAGEQPAQAVVDGFSAGMEQCERRIEQAQDLDELDNLSVQADGLGQLRAYICPLVEVYDQAAIAIDTMEDWGVSRATLKPLYGILRRELANPKSTPHEARGALRTILREQDVWDRFVDEYEDDTKRVVLWLVALSILFFSGAYLALYFTDRWHLLFGASLLLAGASGGCVSVLARMPTSEITSSGASVSLVRRAIGRVGVGVIAGIAGSSLLSWGAISFAVNKVSYGDVISACGPDGSQSCSTSYSLITLVVPLMFGFTERLLTTLEGTFFGRERGAGEGSS